MAQNYVEYTLEPVETTLRQVQQVVECLLHSVIFCRALGVVTPHEEYIEELDVYYARCSEDEVVAKVKKKAAEFVEHVRQHNRGELVLSFDDNARQKWEAWKLTIVLRHNVPQSQREQHNRTLAEVLRDRLLLVARTVDRDKWRVPPVTTKALVPFQFHIATPAAGGGWGAAVTGLLSIFRQGAAPSTTM